MGRIFDLSADAICVFSHDGYFLRANAAIERVLGYRPDELIGTHFKRYIHPEDVEKTMSWRPQVLAGAAVLAFENRYVRKDGSVATILWSGQWSAVDKCLYTVGHDVTERKHLLEELKARAEAMERNSAELAIAKEAAESSDRLKSIFLATMSHELRTPLNSIIGFTGIVWQGLAGPVNAEQKKQLGMVRESARHLLALINDVLDISKIEAGELAVHYARFDLQASIIKVVDIARPLAQSKLLELHAHIAPEVREMSGDMRRVEQILLNLLSNAIKFTERGSVTLEAAILDDFCSDQAALPRKALSVAITDTGIGIKPEDLVRLFQPFRQLDTALSRNHEGTGLGLAICRRLAGLMGGTVVAQSQWQVGSIFTVTLPLERQNQPSL